MIEAFDGPGTLLKGNLHCHSTRSDGEMTPERVCAFYREAGYDFLCLSDHFMERFGFPITDTSPYRTNAFTTIPGAELHAGSLTNGEIWHILAVGLPTDFAETPQDETGPALAQRALDAGAFVALPHPEWYALTLEDALSMPAGVHAVETHNQSSAALGRAGGAGLLDQMLNAGRMAGAIAVDDAHEYNADALGGWVVARAASNEPEAIVEALKRGAYYASTGPELHHAEIEDGVLMIECSPVDDIALVGPRARSKHLSGRDLRRGRLPLKRFSGGWARLMIRDADGRIAWGRPFAVH